MRFLQFLLLAMAVLCAGSLRAAPVDICQAEQLDLVPAMQIFEDTQARLSLDDVARLPEARFDAMTPSWPAQGYSRSAFWLKVQLTNASDVACSRLLVVGAPRLEDIRVYQGADGRWRDAHAGSAHPLTEWPQPATRQPAFPVSLGARENLTVEYKAVGNSMARYRSDDPEVVRVVLRSMGTQNIEKSAPSANNEFQELPATAAHRTALAV